jgi:hypothetical protein
MDIKRGIWLVMASVALAASGPAMAEEPEFSPVTANFTGRSALVLAPANALNLDLSATIEFWVAPSWQGKLPYDAAILANGGARGNRYAVYMTGDGKALAVQSGDHYDGVPFDFTDGALHHVGMIIINETTSVYIDGVYKATLGFGITDVPSEFFSIGSNNEVAPFVGEIGQVRIWEEPLDPDVLAAFSLKPIEAEGPGAHPDIDALVGVSAFANPETGGFIVVGEDDEVNLTDLGPVTQP